MQFMPIIHPGKEQAWLNARQFHAFSNEVPQGFPQFARLTSLAGKVLFPGSISSKKIAGAHGVLNAVHFLPTYICLA